MKDVDELALAMPQATKAVADDGRPTYLVHGKMFCFHRGRRPDAVDAVTGERLDDVFVFRVEDLDVKELLLADARGIFFTTPHWNGYAAVLVRIPRPRPPRPRRVAGARDRRVADARAEARREGVAGRARRRGAERRQLSASASDSTTLRGQRAA